MNRILTILAVLTCSSLATASIHTLFEPAWVDRDEPQAEREARMRVVSEAVKGFSVQDRAAVLAIWWGESRFAKYVLHDCVHKPKEATGNCDNGRARSYGQLHKAACPELHALPRGTGSPESVRIAAECTRRHWRFAYDRCGGNVEQSFASYGGRSCGSTRDTTALKLATFKRLGGR